MSREYRFLKKERLSDTQRIKQIRSHGEIILIPPWKIYRLTNNEEGPRLCVSITKTAGISVIRNRVRRTLREFFRQNKKYLGPYDYYFFSSRNLSHLKKNDWKNIAQQLKNKLTINHNTH